MNTGYSFIAGYCLALVVVYIIRLLGIKRQSCFVFVATVAVLVLFNVMIHYNPAVEIATHVKWSEVSVVAPNGRPNPHDPRWKNYPGPLPAEMYQGMYANGTWKLNADRSGWVWRPNTEKEGQSANVPNDGRSELGL